MALNAAKVRASVVGTISAPGASLPLYPGDFISGDRLSGRYCALQTVDQSERAANEQRKTAGNAAARAESSGKGAFSLRICSPAMVYGRLISLLRFETMAPNKQPVTGTKPRERHADRQGRSPRTHQRRPAPRRRSIRGRGRCRRDGIEIEDAAWKKSRASAREYRLDTVLDLA
ncbi:hypothetical protein [Bradyrhizobium sp. I71]|uniref:hypothetical protein n=1 Tax=Bradyrhizobium sp. I71 TaxID=2590772 RepID=UPI001EF99A35|nr:hypothetical protein [Bradyrhizobium sp. I71]ULK94902.1 hypothetical protein FJV43_22080 [Bradyrhizobium sp. I71]